MITDFGNKNISFTQSPAFMRMQSVYEQFGVSETDCIQAVLEANEFFGLPTPEILDAMNTSRRGTRMEYNNPRSLIDDVIVYDLKQLMKMGIKGRQAFTLTMTHECAHRIFKIPECKKVVPGHWEEELGCDFFIGVRAGLNLMDVEAVRQGLDGTSADARHPEGYMRNEFIRIGLMHGRMNAVNKSTPYFDKYMGFLADALNRNKEQIHKDKMRFFRRTGIIVR